MTTNVLTFAMQRSNAGSSDGKSLMAVSGGEMGANGFGQVLNQIGTGVSDKGTSSIRESSIRTDKSNLKEPEAVERFEVEGARNRETISKKIKNRDGQDFSMNPDNQKIVEDFSQEITSLLCSVLKITPDELAEGLEMMGLQTVDLMEPAQLVTVYGHFVEGFTITDSLTNEEFQLVMEQADELGKSLFDALGVTSEELKAYMDSNHLFAEEGNINLVSDEGTDVVSQQIVSEVGTYSQNDESDLDTADENNSGFSTAQAAGNAQDTANVTGEEVITEDTEGELLENIRQEDSFHQPNMDADKKELMSEDNSSGRFTEQIDSSGKEDDSTVVREGLGEQVIKQENITFSDGVNRVESVKIVDLQSVISEITEYVRLTSGNEFSRIEMQLNPANLGKMIVEVSSAHGEITAKIVAQTEAAKEVVETSVGQMKTNLEQQGVKVAAVEVTVESHAFEQNLQGNQSGEQQQLMREQQENTRKNHLNLNLNDITPEELSALVSEEEILTAKILRESGNTMDLTV